MSTGASRREQRIAIAGIILSLLYEDGGRWALDEILEHFRKNVHTRLSTDKIEAVLYDLVLTKRVVKVGADPVRYCAPLQPPHR